MKSLNFCSTIFLLLIIQKTYAQNSCSSSPCRAPSECENLASTYVCHCKTGIKGQKCDRPMQAGDSLCLSNPCWNGATCRESGSDFQCDCLPGFTGKDCRTIQTIQSPCITNNPCKNGAQCSVVNNEAACTCVGDWTGKYCDTPKGLCDKPNPCLNGGTCSNNVCQCLRNFTGSLCETFRPVGTDKIIKVWNKGFFIANMRVNYEEQVGADKMAVEQKGSIVLGQAYAFYIPGTVNYAGDVGVTLNIDVVFAFRKISVKIQSDPECFHIWGIFFAPSWARVECW